MLGNTVVKSLALLGGGLILMVMLQNASPLFEAEWRPGVGDADGRAAAAAPEADERSEEGDGGEPGRGVSREIALRAGPHGHFQVEAAVDGEAVRFVVDTGASLVVLAPQDARRIGLDPGRLDYSVRAESANGPVALAPVTLREVRIGQLSLSEVEAAVNGAPMAVSLLGNSFLSRLDGFEVVDDRLVLRW